jgi:hypothetical protein
MGFGYRAKYIAETAKLLEKRGEEWLTGLRMCGYEEAKELLTKLHGVSKREMRVCLGSVLGLLEVWRIRLIVFLL